MELCPCRAEFCFCRAPNNRVAVAIKAWVIAERNEWWQRDILLLQPIEMTDIIEINACIEFHCKAVLIERSVVRSKHHLITAELHTSGQHQFGKGTTIEAATFADDNLENLGRRCCFDRKIVPKPRRPRKCCIEASYCCANPFLVVEVERRTVLRDSALDGGRFNGKWFVVHAQIVARQCLWMQTGGSS
jgi:hypothetical protein